MIKYGNILPLKAKSLPTGWSVKAKAIPELKTDLWLIREDKFTFEPYLNHVLVDAHTSTLNLNEFL